MLSEGDNVWRVVQADRMAVIVDADRYFTIARDTFLKAERRILLVGWDFDARIVLSHEGEGPKPIGEFLYWVVERNPDLHLYLLRWDMGAVKSIFRGRTLFTILKWMRHPRITVRLDGHHPTGSSHHQKIVSIDDRLAFCGGIDMTGERWDTSNHADEDPGRKGPGGKPYKPWHDATTGVTGEAARAIAELARHRWAAAGGGELPPLDVPGSGWPEGLGIDFENARIGIARTEPAMPDREPVMEIEKLFLAQIAAARRWMYCESQYFASRRIAEAIARRLEEPDGPEFVIVNPLTAQGWLEPIAMDTARARLVEALRGRDPHGRLRIYHPYTAGGEPIYVHAKITIVDDCSLRVGSANMNNRSLRLDSECDVVIDAALQDQPVEPRIEAIRNDLLAEHLGTTPERVAELLAETGSLIATVEQLRGPGRSLRPYEVPDLPAIQQWLADNEVLDPENPDEMFEPLSGKGLWRGRLGRRK
ncbi:phospholipase D-like domain-containing protein [Sphingomonas bacterium]|uniref:phospholipase D-like domain-containing protein n=1 Tax=Sphingomonas bacterium TaxID=1895847 RepID=UPI00260D644C|nr:phospholipase D-like domain-containing protein [Sphingomonas bacterium]